MSQQQPQPPRFGSNSQGWDASSWLVGCAVGAAAMTGIVIFVFLVALALQPPAWVQIVIGVSLALGGAVFAWLIASAWRSRDRERERKSSTSV